MKKKDSGQNVHRYPWLRALMMIVLYGALLFFLWNFPTPGGRAFFQNLLGGFLYLACGLALLGVTVVFLLLFPFPPFLSLPVAGGLGAPPDDLFMEDEDEDEWEGSLFLGRSLLIPTFKSRSEEIWAILEELDDDLQPDCTLVADPEGGVIAVTVENAEEARSVIREIRSRLKAAGIGVRSPR